MNRKMIANTIGRLIILAGALMLVPLIVSVIYGEWKTMISFLITSAGAAAVGILVVFLTRRHSREIYAKEGFVIAALSWIVMSAIGALPFVISGDIPSYVDAFFETVSGFTTTGASILRDVTSLTHGALFWRSFTHWIGGMGVLVLMMAIVPDNSGHSIFIMRAEMPGPVVDKIVPKVKNTAKILYLMYIVMTVTEVIFLLFGGLSPYESLIYSFGTAGTGGFGLRPDSLTGYTPYVQWVITVFMLLFGVNFNLYYLLTIRRFKSVFKSEELRVYFGIVAVSIVLVAINISGMYASFGETLRNSAFQVASIMTTTGYSSVDFNLWPTFSKVILVLLMFVGGCAGSTAGGLKVTRIILLFKGIKNEIKHMLHPRGVTTMRFENKPVDKEVKKGVNSYFAIYMLITAIIFLLLSIEKFDIETNLTATVACLNNIGPGLSMVGPYAGYYDYNIFSKLILSVAMLLGRLEIYPFILTVASIGHRNRE